MTEKTENIKRLKCLTGGRGRSNNIIVNKILHRSNIKYISKQQTMKKKIT